LEQFLDKQLLRKVWTVWCMVMWGVRCIQRYQDNILLSCDTVQLSRELLVFRRNLQLPSSGGLHFFPEDRNLDPLTTLSVRLFSSSKFDFGGSVCRSVTNHYWPWCTNYFIRFPHAGFSHKI